MSYKHVQDRYGTYGGLAIKPENLKDADVIIQGIPFESGTSGKKGTSFAIEALRRLSSDLQIVSRRGISISDMKICDVGNVPVFPLDAQATIHSIENSIKFLVSESFAPIITIGGDHSIAYPEIKGLSSLGTVGIIWFDAHRDLFDEFVNSKFSHGTSLRRSIELDTVDPKNVLLIGTRYMTSEEQTFLEKFEINELSQPMLEDADNPRNLIKEKIKEISSRTDNLFISIDIDCLDPAFAPGTGTPVGGGMTTSELLNYIWDIPAPFRAIDIVEVSPPLDVSDITIKATLVILTEIIAKIKVLRN
jgi:agmatinase